MIQPDSYTLEYNQEGKMFHICRLEVSLMENFRKLNENKKLEWVPIAYGSFGEILKLEENLTLKLLNSMKFTSTNITIVVNDRMGQMTIGQHGRVPTFVDFEHIEEIRDLLNDIIEKRDEF